MKSGIGAIASENTLHNAVAITSVRRNDDVNVTIITETAITLFAAVHLWPRYIELVHSIGELYPGTISSCSCFTIVKGYEAGYLGEDQNTTVSNILQWNPWIGDQSQCDAGLYANLQELEERPVRIGVNSNGGGPTTASSPSATTTKPPTTTTSTQTGIFMGCREYYVTQSGDTCWAIANDHGIALDEFYAQNPAGK
ncbi:hypothetical protein NUW58_g6276 [Xylaria curta]|uniref:Uncharacterized protein n=1 Tax=Xylaria curta TaxID=42375 RepID=A0ACC1NW62_9PEZI|nr:hypothetical protein NUW58_g6276 [Xylaria curta]